MRLGRMSRQQRRRRHLQREHQPLVAKTGGGASAMGGPSRPHRPSSTSWGASHSCRRRSRPRSSRSSPALEPSSEIHASTRWRFHARARWRRPQKAWLISNASASGVSPSCIMRHPCRLSSTRPRRRRRLANGRGTRRLTGPLKRGRPRLRPTVKRGADSLRRKTCLFVNRLGGGGERVRGRTSRMALFLGSQRWSPRCPRSRRLLCMAAFSLVAPSSRPTPRSPRRSSPLRVSLLAAPSLLPTPRRPR